MALQNQEIAERITQLRRDRGNPPQPVVAAALGVSLRAYQDWEAGAAKPRYLNLERLAEYYGTTEDFILTGSNDGRPASSDDEQLDRIEQKLDRQYVILGDILAAIGEPDGLEKLSRAGRELRALGLDKAQGRSERPEAPGGQGARPAGG